MWSMKSAAIVAVTLWVVILMFIATRLNYMQIRPQDSSELEQKLAAAVDLLKDLKRQNGDLKNLIEDERREHAAGRALVKKDLQTSPSKSDSRFSKDHEERRRQLDRDIWEIYYYLHNFFKKNPLKGTVSNHTEEQLISLLGTSARFGDVDDGENWRRSELQKITDEIQGAITKLQNPVDCSKAKALVCTLNKECGFGCQMHHVAFCFVTAFGAGRTMVMKDDGKQWRYSKLGWTGAFLPVTKCSYEQILNGENADQYSSNSAARVVNIGIIDGLSDRPEHLPLSFPKSYADKLLNLHSNPPAYFISQFLWYLLRSNTGMQKIIDMASSHLPFDKGPIVGLQVRRTDKVGTEAAFHGVDEYMEWAEIWFKVQEKRRGAKITRRVYVATDDPTVVPETKKNYPNYEVYGDIEIANTAQMGSRYTDASLHGVVTDIRLLSQCDYLVCTFSSQVCRMGYELMQVLKGDAGENFHSLDDLYYYGGQFAHEQIAIEDHNPETEGEIELRVGDTVGIAGNHWDGYSKGQNRRTHKTGLYPSYKAVEKWRIVDFEQLN